MTKNKNHASDHHVHRPWPGRPTVLRSHAPDPDASAFLRFYNLAAASRPSNRYPLRQMRSSWRIVTAAFGRARPVARVQIFRISGPRGPIDMRAYHPHGGGSPRPAFVWFHGGAFMMGGISTTDTICRHLACASGAVVVAVRYRLTPEHDLYAGREDCLTALDWVDRHGKNLGIDTGRMAVGGDSAGGNLAAALTQRWRELERTPLRYQVLIYPAANLRDEYPSKRENSSGYLLDARALDWVKSNLDAAHADLSEPWLSPSLHADLSRLPPALVVSAGFDPIRDDGLDYARKLRAGGVAVDLLHYPGQFHGFLNFDAVLDMARDALDRIGEALARALGDDAAASPAPDRTIEVSVDQEHARGQAMPHAVRDLCVAGAMAGERLEQWRCSVTRAMLPVLAMRRTIDSNPFLHPLTTLRSSVMARVAPRKVRQTYAGPMQNAVTEP